MKPLLFWGFCSAITLKFNSAEIFAYGVFEGNFTLTNSAWLTISTKGIRGLKMAHF